MLDTAEVLHAAVPLLMWPPRHVPNPILILEDSKATDDRVALFALFGVRVPAPVAGSEKLGRGKGGLLHVTAYTPWLMPRQEIRNGLLALVFVVPPVVWHREPYRAFAGPPR